MYSIVLRSTIATGTVQYCSSYRYGRGTFDGVCERAVLSQYTTTTRLATTSSYSIVPGE